MAAVKGAKYFITLDEVYLEKRNLIKDALDINVMLPEEFLKHTRSWYVRIWERCLRGSKHLRKMGYHSYAEMIAARMGERSGCKKKAKK